jgi:1,4-alpha-glucan branching enzyme
MAKKFLNITIVGHQGYLDHNADGEGDVLHRAAFFAAISDTYLPLLKMFEALENDRIQFKVGMVFSPTLCALLSDPIVQQQYIDWLDRVVALGETELLHLSKASPAYALAKANLNTAAKNKQTFIEEYRCDILSGFDRFIRQGNIEALATCATYAFLPHYADMSEVLNAQIETGLISHKRFFSAAPDGFWLPYLGYAPGIENALKAYGLNYTILDAHGLLFADPLPEKGIFSPARCENSFAVFARDSVDVYDENGTSEFINNPIYRNQHRDIVYEKSVEELSAFIGENAGRSPSGYKYWANGSHETSVYYEPATAKRQAKWDAAEFFAKKKERLFEAEKICPDAELSLVCTVNARSLGELWHEGIDWLEELFRLATKDSDITLATTESLLSNQFSLQKLNPFLSATSGAGYGENLLDSTNAYILRYARKASERMTSLADRFLGEHGLKARMLNVAAKEVLLAQASDWPKMLHAWRAPDYAKERFRESILAFTTVFDSLGTNKMSTAWLTDMEKKHPLFPWLNFPVFSTKHGIVAHSVDFNTK